MTLEEAIISYEDDNDNGADIIKIKMAMMATVMLIEKRRLIIKLVRKTMSMM
jgi:hypothetical protein